LRRVGHRAATWESDPRVFFNAVGPQQVLARGYSITTLKKGGAIVRSKGQVKGGQRLITHVADGEIESVAEDPNQPTLFE
jgi:exonuclease VII large subunit